MLKLTMFFQNTLVAQDVFLKAALAEKADKLQQVHTVCACYLLRCMLSSKANVVF